MQITQTAEWHYVDTNTKHVAGYKGHRIEIAGHTACVEEHRPLHSEDPEVFVFTVLQDHFRIVEVGQRDTLEDAKSAAEVLIQLSIAGEA